MSIELEKNDLKGLNITAILRALGALSIILAGGIYMLQGVSSLDMGVRNWIIIALMALLTGTGLTCRFILQDGSSARLLLTLATMMFPIQCSQMGSNLLQPDTTHNLQILLTGIASLLMLPSLWLGFSILLRPLALQISGAFLLSCGAILLPFREALPIFILLCVMAIALLAFEKHRLPTLLGPKNLDVIVARLLLWLPLLIIAIRQMFYLNNEIDCAYLALASTVIFICQAWSWSAHRDIKELLLVIATLCLCIAMLSLGQNIQAVASNTIICWLLAAFLFAMHFQLFYLKGIYRKGAIVLMFVSMLYSYQNGVNEAILGWLSSALVFIAAIKYREKLILMVAIWMLGANLFQLVDLALTHLQVNYWLSLAFAGIALVLLASAVERYGRQFLQTSSEYWRDIKSWDY